MNFSPWPLPGKWFRFEWRKSTWVRAKPWYGNYELAELEELSVHTFWFPFLSVRNKWFHFYLGWKPIYVGSTGDPKFFWWPLVNGEPRPVVQLSARWGLEGTS